LRLHVRAITVHWGKFGDRFQGIRDESGTGWAAAAWPGEYVTSYQIEWHLRIASLVAGLAVGVLSLIGLWRKLRGRVK